MKLISCQSETETRCGLLIEDQVYDLGENGKKIGVDIPTTMLDLLNLEEQGMDKALEIQTAILAGDTKIVVDNPILKAPVPNPPSCRDAYAFRQHVATARRNRGLPMIPEFDEFPIFYFTNHNAIYGEGDIVVEDDHLEKLDFELEVTVVIGKRSLNTHRFLGKLGQR